MCIYIYNIYIYIYIHIHIYIIIIYSSLNFKNLQNYMRVINSTPFYPYIYFIDAFFAHVPVSQHWVPFFFLLIMAHDSSFFFFFFFKIAPFFSYLKMVAFSRESNGPNTLSVRRNSKILTNRVVRFSRP